MIVAHPDDETLWAGGKVLSHPEWDWFIVAMCRGSDPDRSPRFLRALERFGAEGDMADLDDGPAQEPLPDAEVEATVLALLEGRSFDLLFTHGPKGEYTRHLRHEETSKAVAALWERGEVRAGELWLFAYEDGGGLYLPRAATDAHLTERLPDEVWRQKSEIIGGIYGFAPESLEARMNPRQEAFRRLESADKLP